MERTRSGNGKYLHFYDFFYIKSLLFSSDIAFATLIGSDRVVI